VIISQYLSIFMLRFNLAEISEDALIKLKLKYYSICAFVPMFHERRALLCIILSLTEYCTDKSLISHRSEFQQIAILLCFGT
jgi:hypothetical protein